MQFGTCIRSEHVATKDKRHQYAVIEALHARDGTSLYETNDGAVKCCGTARPLGRVARDLRRVAMFACLAPKCRTRNCTCAHFFFFSFFQVFQYCSPFFLFWRRVCRTSTCGKANLDPQKVLLFQDTAWFPKRVPSSPILWGRQNRPTLL